MSQGCQNLQKTTHEMKNKTQQEWKRERNKQIRHVNFLPLYHTRARRALTKLQSNSNAYMKLGKIRQVGWWTVVRKLLWPTKCARACPYTNQFQITRIKLTYCNVTLQNRFLKINWNSERMEAPPVVNDHLFRSQWHCDTWKSKWCLVMVRMKPVTLHYKVNLKIILGNMTGLWMLP
jgi:hypothetical protein